MPLSELIINLPKFSIFDGELGEEKLILKVKYEGPICCPNCSGTDLRLKDTFYRMVHHLSYGTRVCVLSVKQHKYHCRSCNIYFRPELPGILKYQRSTEAFKREVAIKHWDGIPQSILARKLKIGWATVQRYFFSYLRLEGKKLMNQALPRVLGIDEHFFSRKTGYATTLVDLHKHKVFDVLPGRSESSLKAELMKRSDRSRVKVICMDLSETYRSISKKYFPNALIVADRFHVIRLINQRFMELWKSLDDEGRKNRGLLSLMRRHEKNLSIDQRNNLSKYLDQIPALKVVYHFKQKMCDLMSLKHLTHNKFREYIPILLSMIDQLKASGFAPLRSLGETLDSWKEEIGRMWRFTKNNSITEGLHNKIERIQRQACGFRNFSNYRTRIKVMCG